jgi:hypothetical protein
MATTIHKALAAASIIDTPQALTAKDAEDARWLIARR